MDILRSKTNEKIRSAVAVRDSSKTRRESKTFFLEGARLCSDAAENGIEIYRTFLSSTASEKYGEYCKRITAASETAFRTRLPPSFPIRKIRRGFFAFVEPKNRHRVLP